MNKHLPKWQKKLTRTQREHLKDSFEEGSRPRQARLGKSQ